MCKTGTFLWGLAAGMVAGAMLEIIILPRPRPRRTAVGKAMQRMGNAMDQALESVAEKMSGKTGAAAPVFCRLDNASRMYTAEGLTFLLILV